jgi:pimeloyl-ACP methyl ester carboxylesterase
MLTRRAWLVLAALLLSTGVPSAQTMPLGQAIDAVTTIADPAQSYALYLPSTYTTDRTWPILIGFHPGARGRAIVDTYREAAERYGFIVVGSNNSRNGPWDVSGRAANAMFQDIGRRFAADGRRIYLTGHSGGSRVALEIALTDKRIAGVIASSAGYPDVRPRAALGFPIFGTAGTDDFNYIEMRMLERPLKTPHRVVIFPGGHTLPPPAVAIQAIEWLELQAMTSGLRPRDEGLIDRFWAAQERAVAAAGETAAAVHLLRATADDFRTLRDVKAIETRAANLAKRPDVKRALHRERDDDDREARSLEELARYQSGLTTADLRWQSLQVLRKLLADLHARATAAEDSPERARARRVLRVVMMAAGEGTQDPDYLALLQQYRLPPRGR